METKEEFIKNELKRIFYSYGYYPFICLIDDFENSNKFEECKLLYELLNEVSDEVEQSFPTKLTEQVTKEYFNYFKKKDKKEVEEQIKTHKTEILSRIKYAKYDYDLLLVNLQNEKV